MVVINMEVGRLLESAASDLPAGVQAYITNMNGEYLLHPDSPRSFGFELGRKDKITTNFPFLKTMFIPRTSGHFPLQAVATGTGAQYWAAERIHFDSGNPGRFLLLAYSIPDAVAAQQITLIPPEQIIGAFFVMLLVSGIALLVLRRTFSPLEQLTAAADKIAAGNQDVLLPQTGNGEIGSLANALGAMLAKLAQREQDILQINAKLEERVRERTFELNNINELLHGLKGKRMLQETEKLLRRNQALMLTSMDGICILDSQGNIVTVNDAFCRILGYTQEEAARLNVADWDMQWTGDKLRERFMDPINNSAIVESMHRRKDGMLINVEVSIAGVVIEGQFLIFASSRDITWRKQAETALQNSEERFRSIFEQAGVGVAIIASNTGRFQQINKIYAEIIGLNTDEMLATSFMEITHPDDLQADLDNMNKLRDGLVTEFTMEKRYIHKDGSIVWVSLTVSPLRLKGDKLLSQHVAIVTDITERKRIENELRIAAAAFETQDAIMITDADGNIIRVNHAFSVITGYSPEEVLGKNFSMMNSGQSDQDACIEMLQQSIHNGSWAGEIWDKRKNGQFYPKWMTITAIKNERQETTHCVSIFSDITARKQIEETKLHESEERFRGTLEQAAVGIAHATLDGHFQQVNQKFCKIVGYTRDELIQMSFQDITFPADLDENLRYSQQLLAGEIPTFSMEKRYVRKDRSLVWVNLTVSLLRDIDGTPKYSIGVIEDITEHKMLAENLQRSEIKFRTVYESSNDAIMLLDESGFLDCNKTTLQMFGCTAPDDFMHKHPSQFSPLTQPGGQNSSSLAEERIATALRDGSNHFEWMHRRADNGKVFPADVLLHKMELDGRMVLQATVRDITERKKLEQETSRRLCHMVAMDTITRIVLDSESIDELLESVLEETLAIFKADRAWVLYPCDPDALTWGVPMERTRPEWPGLFAQGAEMKMDSSISQTFSKLIQAKGAIQYGPDTGHPVPPIVAEHFSVKSQVIIALHPKIGNAWVFGLHHCEGVVKHEDEELELFTSIAQRISDTLSTLISDRQLRESEDRFRNLADQAPALIWITDTQNAVIWFNRSWLEYTGRTIEQERGYGWTNGIHPDDRQRIAALNQTAFDGRQKFDMETRLRRADGTYGWIAETGTPRFDENGDFLGYIGYCWVITEHKRAEQQLRDLSAHIQTVREEEKASVAREIHDDLGGALTALKMDAYWLARNLPAENEMAPLRERVESMSDMIINAVAVTRRVITDLRPTILDDLGLLAALEWQAAQFSKRTGIECQVVCIDNEDCEGALDKTQSINLFRIFQEALTNIARHSGASRMEVELQHEDKEISLSISDNGRGLPEGHTIASTSYGIRGMRERAEQLGGRIKFGNQPGGGLNVRVILPQSSAVKP